MKRIKKFFRRIYEILDYVIDDIIISIVWGFIKILWKGIVSLIKLILNY